MSGAWWVLVLAVATLGGVARAQRVDTLTAAGDSLARARAYEARRAELVKSLQDAQEELSRLRLQRLELEARIDNALAQAMERRAQLLLLSPEHTALRELDSTLSAAQSDMQEQRDRMQALGDAVRRRTGAVLVVLLRVDSIQAGALGGVSLDVDREPTVTRTYSPVSVEALRAGAVDQLYRSEMLPTVHTVRITVTIGGEAVSQSLTVDAPTQTTTYVQFAVQGARVVPATWTSRGTTPF